jgi:calcineurin-like phosphoesterase family protein
MKWYTSDLHFSYEKIINLCNRPFKDVSEMNNKILENFRENLQILFRMK